MGNEFGSRTKEGLAIPHGTDVEIDGTVIKEPSKRSFLIAWRSGHSGDTLVLQGAIKEGATVDADWFDIYTFSAVGDYTLVGNFTGPQWPRLRLSQTDGATPTDATVDIAAKMEPDTHRRS